MKIPFENSIKRLSFLCRPPDIKIAWINPFLHTQAVNANNRNIKRASDFSYLVYAAP